MLEIDLKNFDLSQLPDSEDDTFEFKCSKLPLKDLKKKLGCASSGFANSGGGYFIAGVDANGDADGGFLLKVGKQDLRDWVDQIIHDVEPKPSYDVKLITDAAGRGYIQEDSAVIVVKIHESHIGPHMGPDNRYYIRAGAHTVAAKHFIVEAIWAKRHFSKPRLTHLFRLKPQQENVIQLGILTITDAPAIDVMINLSPIPPSMGYIADLFPLKISIIDNHNPFFFDVARYSDTVANFGQNVNLEVNYHDLSNQQYNYQVPLDIIGSLPPVVFLEKNLRSRRQSASYKPY